MPHLTKQRSWVTSHICAFPIILRNVLGRDGMRRVKDPVQSVVLEVWSRQVAALAASKAMTTLDGQCGLPLTFETLGHNKLASFELRQRRSCRGIGFLINPI